MRLIFVICFVMLALALSSCSSHKQIVMTKEGAATIETNESNGTTTINSKNSTAVIGKNAVDVSKLGLPVYPGAIQNSGGISEQSAQGNSQMVVMTTPDSFDKVYNFYKAQMPAGSERMHIAAGSQAVAQFAIPAASNKNMKSIMITADNGKTTIELMVGSKTN